MNEKTIELRLVRPGERFKLDGVEFVKLDEDKGAAFVLTANTLDFTCPFESDSSQREDHNNFSGSTLSKKMETWLREQHKPIFDATVERPIDLTTMDGQTCYGMPLAVARTLTIDEYRKYRAHIPLTDEPYWLATGWTTLRSPYSDADSAYNINTGGSVGSNNVYSANFAPRPALYLKSSILVSVETEEEVKRSPTIRDYTDTELMDELYRRRVEGPQPQPSGAGAAGKGGAAE